MGLAERHRGARHRGLYAVLIAVVIGCGLAFRSEFLALPPFLAKYGGDALWGSMVFLGLGLLLSARSTAVVAGLAAAMCVTVESSQLYQAPWLDEFRRMWFGRMALGNTFGWGDLAAYLVGILVGGLAEWTACRARSSKAPEPSGVTGRACDSSSGSV